MITKDNQLVSLVVAVLNVFQQAGNIQLALHVLQKEVPVRAVNAL